MLRSNAAQSREAIMLLALAGFNAGISLRCVEPMLPKLALDFGTSVSAASAIITSFALAYAVAVLLQGPLGDRFGKLRVVTIAMACAGAASIGCAFAWSVGSLAGMRLVTGAFASASVALGMAYIGDVVPLGERQTTIAHFIAGSLLGQTLGPLFGGVFTDWLGWRVSFVVLGAVFVLVSAILLVRTNAAWPSPAGGVFNPLAIHRALLRRPAVRWLTATGVAETFFFFGAYAFLGAYFKERWELSYTAIGLLLAGYGIGGLAYAGLVGFFVERLGERGMVLAGGALAFAMFLMIALAPHWMYAIPGTIGLGIAFYLIHNTVQLKATEVAPDSRGSAVALYASAWATGQATGVAAMGVAIAAFGLAPMIAAFGLGFGLLGLWLRSNLHRFRA